MPVCVCVCVCVRACVRACGWVGGWVSVCVGCYVWVCHNLTILLLASCWLKNITNNCKIA